MATCCELQPSNFAVLTSWFRSPTPCFKCNRPLCVSCSGKYCLVPFDEANPEKVGKVARSFCKICFEETSTVDYSKITDVIGPESSDTAFVMVHGGGVSRAMFRPQARILAEAGFKCILPDLPGHGSLMGAKLTPDTCVSTIKSALDENNVKPGDRVIYVGASFGSQVGFYVLDKLPGYFSGAIMMACGQNVGPGAALQIRCGQLIAKQLFGYMSNLYFLNSGISSLEKLSADFHIAESLVGGGTFIDAMPALTDCQQAISTSDIIPRLIIPLLFLNGSDEYRADEARWLALSPNKASTSQVYEGGDHFVSHDSRFVPDILARMKDFAGSL